MCELSSELDGMKMADLSTQTRVIAIARAGTPVRLHPRRDTKLIAGDTAYLVGPYRELLDTLRKGQGAVSDPRRQVERVGGPLPPSRRKWPFFSGSAGTYASARARR